MKNSIVSLNLVLPSRPAESTELLILNGIKISNTDEIYSEIEEENCFALNSNDYGFGRIDFELLFEPIKMSYSGFWVGCVSIRTENLKIKVNPPLGSYTKKSTAQCLTKVSFENKMVVTLSYFFTNAEEKDQFLDAKSFLVEGFIALDNQSNVYGFLCKVENRNNEWCFTEGYTNRPVEKTSINRMVH